MHGIALQGLLRMNRAMILTTLVPEHKIAAIAGSEILSVLGPYINPKTSQDALGFAFAILLARWQWKKHLRLGYR